MEKRAEFFRNVFLATGVVWFFCALAILIFNLSFGEEEIVMTILFPLAYTVVKAYEKTRKADEKNAEKE